MYMSIYLSHVIFMSVMLCKADIRMSSLGIVFLCDDETEANCSYVSRQVLPMEIEVHGVAVNLTGTVVESQGHFMPNLKCLEEYVTNSTILLIGVGASDIINAVTCVADHWNIPAVTYITSHHRTSIFETGTVKINPSHAGLAHALLTIIGTGTSKNTFVICEDSLSTDGFLDVLENFDSQSRITKSRQVLISNSESDFDLELNLRFIHDSGYRIIVVHSYPNLLQRLLSVANSLNYIELGYAWIITEESLPDAFLANSFDADYPNGLLAIEGYETGQTEGLIKDTIEAFSDELQSFGTSTKEPDVPSVITALSEDQEYSKAILRGIQNNSKLFDSNGWRRDMRFRLLNYVKDGAIGEWRAVGHIQDDKVDLQTVVWPGHSIFGPAGMAREYYTISTRPAEPFMYIWGPIQSAAECAGAVQCIHVESYDPKEIKEAVESFRKHVIYPNVSFSVHCCEGVVVDILNHLASELEFDFLLYFHNDSNFGHLKNGSWTGMIGDVVNGAADIMAGAISVTSDRMKGVAFTEPFYYSSFNMISSSTEKYYSLLAFTKPFDTPVWIMIVLSANITAVITSLFEWNSPFGLNPWGKRRKRNYTFGSALTMVYSIWFGHTVSTKSPKSWPSKFVQNIWAVMSIFILASYTANLAAFLAGNTYEDLTYSILDAKLSSKKVGVVKTSAVEEYTKTINSDLHARFSKYYVKDVHEGVSKIRAKQLDLYMDDSPLLEYALSRSDDNCSIKYAAHSFGENAYAFAVRPGSNIKARFDPLILNYMELGLTEDLRWRYMGKGRQCENKRMDNSDLQFGLPHTAGLFVMLLVAVGLSFIVLIIEHVLYFCILPWLRKKPANSVWKGRKVEYVSQRIYRAIHSEKVTPTTQVMVSKVKRKKFELQSKLRKQINSGSSTSMKSYQSVISRLPGFTNMEFFNSPDFNKRGFPSLNSVYTISGNVSGTIKEEDEEDDDVFDDDMYLSVVKMNDIYPEMKSQFTSQGRSVEYEHDNLGFELDDEVTQSKKRRKNMRSHSERFSKTRSVHRPLCRQGATCGKVVKGCSRHSDSETTFTQASDRRYETWPSPKQRKKSLKRLQNNHQTVSFSNTDNIQYPKTGSRIVNEIEPPITKRKCSAISLDCYQEKKSNVNLKDNRVKSSIRHHAMAYRRGPSFSMDESAVEALSKEDLLVLWKRSEIELQTKLNRILHQNTHLRRLVNIVEENASNLQEQQFRSRNPVPLTSADTTSGLDLNVIISTKL